jgi:structural maintenance of chromosome 1
LEKRLKQTEQNIERVKRDGQQQEQVVASLDRDIQLLNEAERSYNGKTNTQLDIRSYANVSKSVESIPASSLTNGPTLTTAQLMDYERRKQEVSIKAVEEQHQLQQLERQFKTEKQRIDDKKSKIDQLKESESENVDSLRQAEEEKAALAAEAEIISEQLTARRSKLSQLENERTTVHTCEVKLNEELQIVLNKLMEASVTQQESDKDTKFNESIAVMKQIYPSKVSDKLWGCFLNIDFLPPFFRCSW